MKKILLLSLATAMALSAAAQTTFSGSTLYGYCTNPSFSTGLTGNAQLGVAMQLDASTIKTFNGCKITAIAIANGEAADPAATPSVPLEIFVSELLTDFEQTFSGEMDLTNPYAYKEYPLATPIEINNDTPELFFGYSVKCDAGKYWPLVTDYTADTSAGPGDYIGQLYNGSWTWSQMRTSVGMPCIRLKIEGDNMAANRVNIIEHHLPTYTAPGQNAQACIYVKNMAYNAVDAVTVDYSINGNEASMNLQLPQLLLNNEYIALTFELPMPDVEGNDLPLSVNVSNINEDATNNASATLRTASTTYLSVENGFPQAMIVEEATGTWCGFCPIGIVGLHNMIEAHEDDPLFIPIAAHSGDRMAVQSYNSLFGSDYTGDSYPSCVINRNMETYGSQSPSFSYLEEAYKSVTAQQSLCQVEIADLTFNESTKKFAVTAEVEFAIPVSGEYGFCYVLTEDNVGPYDQTNYYSPSLGYGLTLEWWDQQPQSVSTYFDHVARYIYPFRGLSGSVPSEVEAGVKYSHEVNIPTSNVTDMEFTNMIVMLVNRTSGRIENATMVKYGSHTSLDELTASPLPTDNEIYDLQGRQVTNPKHGLYIIGGKKVIL